MANGLYVRHDFVYLFQYLINVFRDLYDIPRVIYKYNIKKDRIICIFAGTDNWRISISKMDVEHGTDYGTFMRFFDSVLDHYNLDKSIWYAWLSVHRYI